MLPDGTASLTLSFSVAVGGISGTWGPLVSDVFGGFFVRLLFLLEADGVGSVASSSADGRGCFVTRSPVEHVEEAMQKISETRPYQDHPLL